MSIPKESESIINLSVTKEKIKLKDFLKEKADISSRLFNRLIKKNSIYINGNQLGDRFYVGIGDVVTLELEQENPAYEPQKIDLEIIYEDLDLLIINKPANILVHPTKNHPKNTITNGVQYYFQSKDIKKKVRLVNRLDRDTSGILVVAKNSFGHQQMANQFKKSIEKKYLAITKGIFEKDKGVINLPIGKEDGSIRNVITDKGRESITEFNVIDRFSDATLVELKIITGRTHQIRVHLAHLNHPIIGDSLYGEKSDLINRQSLHSHYLKFKTPRKDKHIEIHADLPSDMKNIIEKLK